MRPSLPIPHFMILFINFFRGIYLSYFYFRMVSFSFFSLLDSTTEALPRFYIDLLWYTIRIFVPHNGKVWGFQLWMYRMLLCDNVYCNLCLHSTFTHSVESPLMLQTPRNVRHSVWTSLFSFMVHCAPMGFKLPLIYTYITLGCTLM